MTERKFKLNLIDILILVVLAVAVAVLGYIFVFSDDTTKEGEMHTIEYVLEITSVNKEIANAHKIEPGASVILDHNRTKVIGTVSKPAQYLDCYKASYSNDEGKEVYTIAENLTDIYVTFTAEAELTEWGYRIAETEYLPVNAAINLIIGDFHCSAVCIENNIVLD